MATFEISRAGSNYPTLARNELPMLAIFKNRQSEGMGPGTFIHVGKFSSGSPASVNVLNYTLSTARNTDRQVAMVGQAQYTLRYLPDGEHKQLGLRYTTVGDIVVIDGQANSDGLPIAFGYMGRDDDGYAILADFNDPGTLTKLSSSTVATVVGRFGIVGTEV